MGSCPFLGHFFQRASGGLKALERLHKPRHLASDVGIEVVLLEDPDSGGPTRVRPSVTENATFVREAAQYAAVNARKPQLRDKMRRKMIARMQLSVAAPALNGQGTGTNYAVTAHAVARSNAALDSNTVKCETG